MISSMNSAVDQARAEGKNLGELVREAIALERAGKAVLDGNGRILNDPASGRGLEFARWAKTSVVARAEGRSARDVAHAWSKTNRAYSVIADKFSEAEKNARALTQTSLTSGGALVPPEMYSEIIELLYAKTVALAHGARTLEFSGSISLGRINQGATVYYVGEAQNITPSQQGTGELRMTGKKAAAIVMISNELIRNPAVGADAMVRDDLLNAIALRRDLSALRGTGDTFQPKGVTGWINANNAFASSGTTTAQRVADLAKMIRLVDQSNVSLDSGGFAMSPRSKWSLFSTLDGNAQFVFAAQLAQGMLFGFPVRTTTQIPDNLGAGSDSEVYFGAWNDLIIGLDQATPMQVEAFPNGAVWDGTQVVSGISSDITPIRLLEGHDICLRHDSTFSKLTGVQWT
jgi:HK97 family phage major capsid protein